MPLDAASRRFPWLDLLVVSFLLLFFELSVIRWVSATVRVVAYFSNIVMISCFLSAAWGCIARPGRDLFRYFPGLALALVVLCWHFGVRGVENPLPGIDYFFGGIGHYSFVVAVPAVFVLNAAVFAAVGHRMGRELSTLTPLYGYSINLLGSLLGSAAFALISFAQAGPTSTRPASGGAAPTTCRTSCLAAGREAGCWCSAPVPATTWPRPCATAPARWSPWSSTRPSRSWGAASTRRDPKPTPESAS